MPAWLATLLTRRMLICVFTGFASGMPLYLLLNLLPAWLRTEGVSLKAIGLFALIQFPYTWKFLWAPLLDRFVLPLGRRRGWIFLTQLALLVIIALLGRLSPATDLGAIIWLAGTNAPDAFMLGTLGIALAVLFYMTSFLKVADHNIRRICDRCVFLDRGKVKMIGESDKVVSAYLK